MSGYKRLTINVADDVVAKLQANADERGINPDWAVHPGEILQEELDERGMTQVELAGAIGCAYQHVNRICRGHVNIEAPFAVRLEKVLGISAELWLRLQLAYSLHHARTAEEPTS